MVIGKSYKENLKLIIVLYTFLLIVLISGIVCSAIFLDNLVLKTILIVLASTFLLLSSYFPYYVYKGTKTPENVIIYNAIDETITINGYKRKQLIKISDIAAITVHNVGTKLLFANRIEEGKLYFYLNDGTRIKTEEIDDVYDAYDKINEIVFVNREYQTEVNDQLIDKLNGWGAKKEYPSIISVLVALFIPFFGMFFVSNQEKFKKMKNGKATGLMAVAFVFGLIWILAIVLFIVLL